MPTYYVTLNRPTVEAATPEEAADKCLSDPLEVDDAFYVKEVPVDGSVHIVPGAAAMLGGAVPQPDEVYQGPEKIPQLRRK